METMMDRFLCGQNHEIADVVAMHYCEDLDDLVQYVMKVKQ